MTEKQFTFSVKKLIEELQKIEDKTKSVYIYVPNIEEIDVEIQEIRAVDEISDRVDINI